jgi:hypothetical protein
MYYGGMAYGSDWKIGLADYAPGSAPRTFSTFGSFLSAVVDSGSSSTTWDRLSWSGVAPYETGIEVNVRIGNTPTPDPSWTTLPGPVTSPGSIVLSLPPARFAQVGALLQTANDSKTPVLDEIVLSYSPPGPPPLLEVGSIGWILLVLVVPAAAVMVLIFYLAVRRPIPTTALRPAIATCSTCGNLTPRGSRFCGRCGQPLGGPRP